MPCGSSLDHGVVIWKQAVDLARPPQRPETRLSTHGRSERRGRQLATPHVNVYGAVGVGMLMAVRSRPMMTVRAEGAC
jgi:hypothetical protein